MLHSETQERLKCAWDKFIRDSEDSHLGFDRGFDKNELWSNHEDGGFANVKYIFFYRRDHYHWLAKTLLCPMCNARTNYRTTNSPFYQRHRQLLNGGNNGKICFYSGHPVDKSVDDAELTVSQVAFMLRRSDSWVLSLVKFGILKAEVWGNMYVIRKKDIGNIDDMKKQLKIARKNNWPRINYINCHLWKTHITPQIQAARDAEKQSMIEKGYQEEMLKAIGF